MNSEKTTYCAPQCQMHVIALKRIICLSGEVNYDPWDDFNWDE